ncbi:MAG: hypothetical protein RML56_07910 [Burkholderiales bacterium]|nr:hypothetical protein [Burkholderiales bacterium]
MLARLRGLKPTGRIVLELPENAKLADLPDLPLEDGDRLYVPPVPSTVSVFGTVFGEGAFLYRPEKTVTDYLAQAGGPRREADERSIFVLRADGSVVSRRQAGWLAGSLAALKPMPGDAIVVPEQLDRTPFVEAPQGLDADPHELRHRHRRAQGAAGSVARKRASAPGSCRGIPRRSVRARRACGLRAYPGCNARSTKARPLCPECRAAGRVVCRERGDRFGEGVRRFRVESPPRRQPRRSISSLSPCTPSTTGRAMPIASNIFDGIT